MIYLDNPQIAFEEAIQEGTLSKDKTKNNFAGNYMYMYTSREGVHAFKHKITRKYIGGV